VLLLLLLLLRVLHVRTTGGQGKGSLQLVSGQSFAWNVW
jgi:hypothetical protein